MVYKKRTIIFRLFLFCIIIIFISIYIIKTLGLKTIEIEKTTLEQGINVNAFIIQKEDIVYFNGINSIEMKVEEGVKVPAQSIIAYTKDAVFNNQDSLDLEIINWKLKNEMYQENKLFRQDLDKINQEIKNLELNIERKKRQNKHEQLKNLERKIDELLHKKLVIEGSFRFAFTDYKGLNDIKSQLLKYENNNTSVIGQISPKKIGINYPSYIFFQKDGLENLLHNDLLGEINSDYYSEIENFISQKNFIIDSDNEQILKFVDDTKLYLITKIPEKLLFEKEEKLINIKNDINSQWQESGQSNIYEFIEKRRDILKLLPEIKIKWKGRIIKGILIDSNNNNNLDNEKVIVIKIDSQNHRLIGERLIEIYIYDNLYKGFIIPNNSIIQKDGKDGVVLLGKANEEIYVEVFVKSKLDEFLVLDPAENTQLKPGNKILANPK